MTETEVQRHVEGCKAGNRASQKWVYERYHRKMFGVCLRYIQDQDAVQDVLQEGFLKVFGNIGGYTSKGSFEGWIRRIMVNTAVDHLRKQKSAGWVLIDDRMDSGLEVDNAEDEVEEDVSADFTVEDVHEAMASLTPMYRLVFNLYVFEQQGHQEIADRLGINVGTSKSNLAKARRNVKQFLLDGARSQRNTES